MIQHFIRPLQWTLAFAVAPILAQVSLPAPDANGWIKLFRGTNTSDFYTFYAGAIPSTRKNGANFPDNTFKIKGDTVQVSGSPTGHMIFKQAFSHYRIRYQVRFTGNLGNCGMLLHIQENDTTLWNNFPRSIESQGDPTQGMGQIWAIGRVWVTVRATGNNPPKYDPKASEIDWGARDDNSRLIYTTAGNAQPKPPELTNGGWVTQEADVHGSDSLFHIVMGDTLIRYRNPRVAPRNNPNQIEKVLASGLLAWQSEGTPVWYRNIEIKLYPKDPLYKTTYVDFQNQHAIRMPAPKRLVFNRDGMVSILRAEAGKLGDAAYDVLGQRRIMVPSANP
jgi:Domain of Unknown Function (DUF1080)